MDPEEVAVLQQIAEEPSGGIVVISGEQDGIKVSAEVGGFETVKPRRVVLSGEEAAPAVHRGGSCAHRSRV